MMLRLKILSFSCGMLILSALTAIAVVSGNDFAHKTNQQITDSTKNELEPLPHPEYSHPNAPIVTVKPAQTPAGSQNGASPGPEPTSKPAPPQAPPPRPKSTPSAPTKSPAADPAPTPTPAPAPVKPQEPAPEAGTSKSSTHTSTSWSVTNIVPGTAGTSSASVTVVQESSAP